MKAKKVLTDRQLLIVTFKQNAKLSARLKTLEEAFVKRTNIDWFDNDEAASYVGLSTRQLYRKRVQGKIKEYRDSNTGNLRFRKIDLDNFLNGK